MTIHAEFNNYDEMLSFCRKIANADAGKQPAPTTAIPAEQVMAVEEKKLKKEKAPVKQEPAPDPEPEELPFTEKEPVKEEKPPVKKEDVRKILAAKKREGKDVSAVIRSFGVELFKEIPEEKYAELLEKVEEL